MAKPRHNPGPKAQKPQGPAVVAEQVEEEEEFTFTTLKKRVVFNWLPTEFSYVDGRRTGVKKEGVAIELIRGQRFFPEAFCLSHRGQGWKEGELIGRANDLIAFLREKADDRARPEVIAWENRPRPMAQIVLEGENATLKDKVAQYEEFFAEAVKEHPELAALREKVMAGA